MSEVTAGEELLEVVFAALDHGIESVSGGGPLIPFVLADDADGRSLTRFAADTLEESQAQARRHVASSDVVRAAIAIGNAAFTGEGEGLFDHAPA